MKYFSLLLLVSLVGALCHFTCQVDGSPAEKPQHKSSHQLDHHAHQGKENVPASNDHQKQKNMASRISGKEKKTIGKPSTDISKGSRAENKMHKSGQDPVQKKSMGSKGKKGKKNQAKPNRPHRFLQEKKRNSLASTQQQNGIITLICNLLKMIGIQNFLFFKDLCAPSPLTTTVSKVATTTSTSIKSMTTPRDATTAAAVDGSSSTITPVRSSISPGSNPTATSQPSRTITAKTLASSTVTLSAIPGPMSTAPSSGGPTITSIQTSSPASSANTNATSSSMIPSTSAMMSTMTSGLITTSSTDAPTTVISSSTVSATTQQLPTLTPSTDVPTTSISTTVSMTTLLPTTTPDGTYFSGQDDVQFNLACSPLLVIVVQAAFYGSSTCGPHDITNLMTNMTSGMQTFYINPSSAAFNSSCPTGGNNVYGWYKCNNSTIYGHYQFAIGGAFNSTFSLLGGPSSIYHILPRAFQYITPDLTCTIDDSMQLAKHPLNGFYSDCFYKKSCLIIVNNAHVIGSGTPTMCNTTSAYMFLKVIYDIT